MRLNATAGTVLGFLLDAPKSGYRLSRDIQALIGGFWHTTQSQIYRELAVLEDAKLIKSARAGARARREHAITPAGKTAFREWINAAPGEALVRDPFALRVFFAEHVEKASMLKHVQNVRALHENRLERLRQRDRSAAAGPVRRAIALDIRRAEMTLAWLDSLRHL